MLGVAIETMMKDGSNSTSLTMLVTLGIGGVVGGIGLYFFLFHQAVASRNRNTPGKPFLTKERQSLRLSEKVQVSHDTCRLIFALPSPKHILGLPIGKHLKLFCPASAIHRCAEGKWNGADDHEANKDEIERKYTPITGDETPGRVELLIKVYRKGVKPQFPDGGKMSQYLDTLSIGDSLELLGPIGLVEYRGNGLFMYGKKEIPKKKVAMIAGGTGITPMLQVIHAVLRDPDDPTEISLIFANQTESDILLRSELEDLQRAHPTRFHLWFTVDAVLEPSAWKFDQGYVTKEMIKQHLPSPDHSPLVLVCGPPPMVKFACKANLEELQYDKKDVLEF